MNEIRRLSHVIVGTTRAMLSMGSSKSWPKALEAMTGERQLNASDILEYFRPLEQWLLKTNEQLGVHIGWEPSDSKKAIIFETRFV